MHVLAVTPHNRLEPETIRALFTQTYAGSLSHVFMRDNPEVVPGHNIIRAYKRLEAIFLEGPYDALWVIENDLIPPPDALAKMLAVDGDIVYGPYLFRRGVPSMNIVQPGTRIPQTEAATSWRRDFAAGAVVACGGLGLGCTLIYRHVLEKLPLRSEGGGGDADSCLAADAHKAGFSQMAHLGVVCGHKRPDGVTLWPTAEKPFFKRVGMSQPRLDRVTAVQPFAVWPEDGTILVVGQGELAAIDFELAANMVACGQAEYAA